MRNDSNVQDSTSKKLGRNWANPYKIERGMGGGINLSYKIASFPEIFDLIPNAHYASSSFLKDGYTLKIIKRNLHQD